MIGLLPVEAAAVDKQNLLFFQQVKRKLFVVCDVETLDIDLREDVERGIWLFGRDAGNVVERLVDVF